MEESDDLLQGREARTGLISPSGGDRDVEPWVGKRAVGLEGEREGTE